MARSVPTLMVAAAVMALALVSTGGAQEAPSSSPAASDAADERLFAILLEPGEAWKPGLPFQEQGLGDHLAYWIALHRQGRLVTAGPLGDDSGLVLLYAADQRAADAILNADPAIRRGYSPAAPDFTPRR